MQVITCKSPNTLDLTNQMVDDSEMTKQAQLLVEPTKPNLVRPPNWTESLTEQGYHDESNRLNALYEEQRQEYRLKMGEIYALRNPPKTNKFV